MILINWILSFLNAMKGPPAFLGTAVEVATIWGLLYTLPNSIKQMRAVNASENAENALKLLLDINEMTIQLLHSTDANKDVRIKNLKVLYEQLSFHLNALNIENIINKYLTKVQKRLTILKKHDGSNKAKIEFLENEFGDNWREQKTKDLNEIIIPFIENIKEILKPIAHNPKMNWESDLLKYCIVVFFIYIIKKNFPNYEDLILIFLTVALLARLLFRKTKHYF